MADVTLSIFAPVAAAPAHEKKNATMTVRWTKKNDFKGRKGNA